MASDQWHVWGANITHTPAIKPRQQKRERFSQARISERIGMSHAPYTAPNAQNFAKQHIMTALS